jgi:hypothetical protein
MSGDIEAYSSDTGKRYPNWDALVQAESNGYVVVTINDRPGTYPAVTGPVFTADEGRKLRRRVRRKLLKEETEYPIHTHLRVLWKEHR